MRKRILTATPPEKVGGRADWLDLDALADVEISSEDPGHPIESALGPEPGTGWRAGTPGRQVIRLLFARPQPVRCVRLCFEEKEVARTQEYLLRWAPRSDEACREIVRQQWNFDPRGATVETEQHEVDLPSVTVLELVIDPDIGGGTAFASLVHMQLG